MKGEDLPAAPAWRRAGGSAGVAVIVVGFLGWSLKFIAQSSFIGADGARYFGMFDDALIAMRYGWNLSHGAGLVWNVGQHVEGYTSLLMTLMSSLATLVLDKRLSVLAVQLLGIPTAVLSAILAGRIAVELARERRDLDRSLIWTLAFLGSLSYYPAVYWPLVGMETGLVTAAVLATILSALVYVRKAEHSALFAMALLAGLAWLARPDSVIATLPWCLVCVALALLRRPRQVRAGLVAIGILVLFPAAQLGFRWTYYHSLVPLTYTLKLVGTPLGVRVRNGIGFLRPFFRQVGPLLALAAPAAIFPFDRRKLGILGTALLIIAYQIGIGGDAWTYWRFVSPAVILSVILAVLLLMDISARIVRLVRSRCDSAGTPTLQANSRPWAAPVRVVWTLVCVGGVTLLVGAVVAQLVGLSRGGHADVIRYAFASGAGLSLAGLLDAGRFPRTTIAIVPLAGLLLWANLPFLQEALFLQRPFQWQYNRDNVNAALGIDLFTTQDASVGVFWAGSIPFYTSRPAIDFLGKSDPYIANLPPDLNLGWSGMSTVPGHNKYDLEYSIARLQPTYVQSFEWGRQNLWLTQGPNYVRVPYGGVDIYLRRGSYDVLWDKINHAVGNQP